MQIWPILLCAAHNHKTLTYNELASLIGMGANLLAQTLDRIAKYCQRNDLPPLTALVISHKTGEPGSGLSTMEDYEKDLKRVFEHKWFARPPIQMSDLEEHS